MQRIKKRNGKRILSCILTFAVVAGLLPGSLLVAHADTFTEGQAVRYQSTPAQPVTIEQSGYYYVEAFGGNGGAGGAQGSGGSTDYRASGGVGAEARTLYWFDAGAMIYIQAGTVGSNGFRDTNNTNNSFPYPGVVGGTGTYFGSGGASGAGGTNGGVLAAGVRGGSGGGGGAASGILVGGTELSNIYLAAGGGGGAGGTSRNGTGGNGGAAGTAGFNAEKNGSGLGGTTQNLNLTNGSIGGAGAGGYTQNGGGGGGGGGGGFDGTSGGGGESGTGGVSCGIASSTSNGGGGGAGGSSYTKNVATTPANLILPENSTRTNANGEVIITYLGAGYTVTYDANGGTGEVPVDSTTYPSGASVTVLGQGTLEKAGFSFSGWQQDINFYSEGDTFDIADDITLYAIWIPTYNVTYDANGAQEMFPLTT